MLPSRRTIGLSLLLFLGLFAWVSFRLLSPPPVMEAAENPNSFSAARAYEHIKMVAREPHNAGTPAHREVLSYIVDYCQEKGLETSIQEEIGYNSKGTYMVAGAPKNIIARLKGTSQGKAVLVMSHYDSKPQTPGAADDASGVASMLETIDLLQKEGPLNNDVIFLFTDLEEAGLLGAEAFVSQYEQLHEVGMVLNFEARGNSGINFTFEISDGNGWVVREFAKAVERPYANSLAYEIYKLLPNDTDFSRFRDTGISGLNSAFIEGYTYYHSMADTPENINLRSVQHQGDLMLGMVRHFANMDLSQTKSEDAIFFNPIGSWLVIYDISWDYPLMVFTILLFAAFLFMGYKKGRIRIAHMFVGTALYLAAILLTLGLVWLLQQAVLAAYPYYTNFYSDNFYNANYYLITIIGLALLSFTFIFSRSINRYSFESLFAGGLLVLLMLMLAFKSFVYTGAFVLYVPLMVALTIFIILFLTNTDYQKKPLGYALAQMLLLAVPLGMWIVFVYLLFTLFSFSLPFAAALFICFFYPLLIPAHKLINGFNRYAIASIAGLMIVAGIITAHFEAGYNKAQPLQTELMYAIDLDEGKAMWISPQQHKDEWNAQYLRAENRESFEEFYPGLKVSLWKSEAGMTVKAPAAGTIELIGDSLIAGSRELRILVKPSPSSNSFDLWLPESSRLKELDSKPTKKRPIPVSEAEKTLVRFFAPPVGGVELVFSVPDQDPVSLRLIERILGLPDDQLIHKLPESMIYGPGRLAYMSNTTQIKQTIAL